MAKGSALRKNPSDSASAEFAALLDESLGGSASFEGSVVKGTIIRIANDFVTVDVGLKSEGRVALREFTNGGTTAPEVKKATWSTSSSIASRTITAKRSRRATRRVTHRVGP